MFGRGLMAMLLAAGAALCAGGAVAQEDLNRGKTPAQLFASDCADCHRNPRALGNRDNAGSLANFLRVHYTASRESAAALADYLVALGPEPRSGSARPSSSPSRPRPAAREQHKPGEGAKPEEPAKPAEAAKPEEAAKPAETSKPAEPAKTAEPAKPADEAPPKPPEAVPPAPAEKPASEAPAPAAAPADPQ